jgi:hypothetical protein
MKPPPSGSLSPTTKNKNCHVIRHFIIYRMEEVVQYLKELIVNQPTASTLKGYYVRTCWGDSRFSLSAGDPDILAEVFHCFFQSLQANARIEPQTRPRLLPSNPLFSIH